MELGFAHFYHLDLSLLPFDPSSLESRLSRAFSMMRKAGVQSFRPHVHWNEVEPVVLDPGLTRADLTDAHVAEYAEGTQGITWEKTDLYCFSSQEGAPGAEWHRRRAVSDVENWWGLVRADGSTRPAYAYLVERAAADAT